MQSRLIRVAESAIETIKDECARHRGLGVECGGSLVGFLLNGIFHIIYAFRTGDEAKKAWGGVTTDEQYQNGLLQVIRDLYPDSDFSWLADYHLHPMYYPHLSRTDIGQIRSILTDKDYGLDELPIILVTCRDDELVFCPFIVSLGSEGKVVVEDAELETIPIDSPIITEALGGAYIPIDEIEASLIGNLVTSDVSRGGVTQRDSSTNSFYDTKEGKARAREEAKEIVKLIGHAPKQEFLEEHGVLRFQFSYEDYRFDVLLPPEYPLNPASIFARRAGDDEPAELGCRHCWNSLSTTVDIIKPFLANNTTTKENEEHDEDTGATKDNCDTAEHDDTAPETGSRPRSAAGDAGERASVRSTLPECESHYRHLART